MKFVSTPIRTRYPVSKDRPEVLFLCVHNAGRSQMAAALLARHGGGEVVVHSAGSAPGETLNPAVVVAMAEVGIDISAQRPKRLTDAMAQGADVIVTMGCGDTCPLYPGKRYVDWDLPDPANKPLDEVRPIRDEISSRVDALLMELLRRGSEPIFSSYNGLGRNQIRPGAPTDLMEHHDAKTV